MDRGTIIDGRFRVEDRRAAGGMGEIHLATDLETSSRVALKILRWQNATLEARFAREAALLAELSHPGIVRYVAHGRSDAGGAYLVMEWIDGEPLVTRLERGRLTVAESLTLGVRVAEALAVAHHRGIVHRDLKPANLFCEGGDVGRIKVLDFGLARNAAASLMVVTRTGELAGTPSYMAPEQARGLHDVDARADVYSLGCVLFECLTGRPAIVGEHVYAVLAKILIEEVPPVSELRPEVSPAVDDLIARMLAKNPSQRPADASEVLVELERVVALGDVPATVSSLHGLGRAEQRVMCVILAANRAVDREIVSSGGTDVGPTPSQELTSAVDAYHGTLERLAGGSLVVAFGGGSALDLAARAARCALAMSVLLPDKQVAVATGRGLAHERIPVGAAIDEAARLIARGANLAIGSEPSATSAGGRPTLTPWTPVRIDEVTGNLLDPRFELGVSSGIQVLLAFTEYREAERTLLGKPTTFVGRDRELSNLLGTLEECCHERMAQAVLVTGPAGAGKSRLRQEVLRKIPEDLGAIQVWIGRADPMSAGAPLSLLAQMIRREAGFAHGEHPRRCRRKLRARVSRHVPPGEVERVTMFLAEMCGVPFDDDERWLLLRAARGDAAVMGDQMRRAWEDLLTGECRTGPLILVLEDLHWGDLPTVKFIDGALRALARQPILVLALARPEVHELFPDLWSSRVLQVIHLRPLPGRAARTLIEQSLGTVSEEVIGRIIGEAAGNAFYLEELIRAASLGEDNPGTVLAMISSRLEALPGEQRRVLRAGSILGESFWPAALCDLVGRDLAWVTRTLDMLVDEEWLTPRADSRRADHREYAFRHALVREAAYAMLTDDDRRLGHHLVGDWLEQHGETDAMTLGEHFERGGEPGRAVGWYARAARQALEGTDIRAGMARAHRGLACAAAAGIDAASVEIGQLRVALAEAYTWLGENVEAEADGVAALELLTPFSMPWYAAAAQVALAAGRLGHYGRVTALAEALRDVEVDGAHAAAWMRAAFPAAQMVNFAGGQLPLVDALMARMEALMPAAAALDPSSPGYLAVMRGQRAGETNDYETSRRRMVEAATFFEQIGNRRRAAVARHDAGSDCMELGAWEQAELELRTSTAVAEQIGMTRHGTVASMNLGMVRAMLGDPADGERLERAVLAELAEKPDPRLESGVRNYLTRILLLAGSPVAAEAEARLALTRIPVRTTPWVHLLGSLAFALIQQGRSDEGLEVAREAMDVIAALGGQVENDGPARLAWAEALHATGDRAGAGAAIASARDRVAARAARIRDDELRTCFVTRVWENARTLELARAWLGEAG